MRYDRRGRLVGHDYPGVLGPGFVQFELDELEPGGPRVAQALDDEEQAWWEIVGNGLLKRDEANDRGGQ